MTDRSGKPDDDHWQTPQWLYDQLDAEFHFDFDPCPIHADFDGLAISWGGSNFINPPYNRADKPKFIQKSFDESKLGKTCVLLIPSATGTSQFHDLMLPHAEIRFLRGRITFVPAALPRNATDRQIREYNQSLGKESNSTKGKHDSMLVIFRAALQPATAKGDLIDEDLAS